MCFCKIQTLETDISFKRAHLSSKWWILSLTSSSCLDQLWVLKKKLESWLAIRNTTRLVWRASYCITHTYTTTNPSQSNLSTPGNPNLDLALDSSQNKKMQNYAFVWKKNVFLQCVSNAIQFCQVLLTLDRNDIDATQCRYNTGN